MALADPQLRAEWEKETAATLKRLGFPVQETPASATSILPRALQCITKRLEKLGEFLRELEDSAKEQKKEQKNDDNTGELIITKTLAWHVWTTPML